MPGIQTDCFKFESSVEQNGNKLLPVLAFIIDEISQLIAQLFAVCIAIMATRKFYTFWRHVTEHVYKIKIFLAFRRVMDIGNRLINK